MIFTENRIELFIQGAHRPSSWWSMYLDYHQFCCLHCNSDIGAIAKCYQKGPLVLIHLYTQNHLSTTSPATSIPSGSPSIAVYLKKTGRLKNNSTYPLGCKVDCSGKVLSASIVEISRHLNSYFSKTPTFIVSHEVLTYIFLIF